MDNYIDKIAESYKQERDHAIMENRNLQEVAAKAKRDYEEVLKNWNGNIEEMQREKGKYNI